jgi:LytR cell envelope-related transcriptional attenuator
MLKNLKFLFALALLAAWGNPSTIFAQEAITLSISPTLYDMSAEPGQEWRSALKVVNVNPFDLTVYAEVVNFTPRGEGGDGRFIPIDQSDTDGVTIAEWFTISNEPIVIPREQTIEIPFTVKVPADASPGGHFAAILIGTKPIAREDGQARLQTAQMVTSLFFARVAGDVIETGSIREFTTTKSLLGTPEVTFSLRFENKGNVHLKPQGEIRIFNMWGEERGIIPINQYSNFGNVLPESIRKFIFTWKGEWSVSDIGRYTAVATLGYGAKEKQFTTSETVFWVLPIKLILGILIGLGLFFGLLTWLVRLYVRHMLVLAGVSIEEYDSVATRAHATQSSRKVSTKPTKPAIHAPLEAGILDLTKRLRVPETFWGRLHEFGQFVIQYKLFFLGVTLLMLFIAVVTWYIKSANTEHRAYEVIYMQNENTPTETVSSEDIIYNQMRANTTADAATSSTNGVTVAIVNRSGEPGAGARARLIFENLGYEVNSLTADFSDIQERTVIVSSEGAYTEALAMSQVLKNAPVSLSNDANQTSEIVVFVGSDMSPE